jgi:hypothetical protein
MSDARFYAQMSFTSTGRHRSSSPPGIQSARRPQLNERQEVPPTRLSGRQPRPGTAPRRAAARAGTGCSSGSAPDLSGRSQEHQHARVPARRALRPVRAPGAGRHRVRRSMFEVRYRASLVRAVCVIRPGQPIRMCPTGPGAGLAQERSQWLHIFLAADDRRARNDNAAQQRRAKSVR